MNMIESQLNGRMLVSDPRDRRYLIRSCFILPVHRSSEVWSAIRPFSLNWIAEIWLQEKRNVFNR